MNIKPQTKINNSFTTSDQALDWIFFYTDDWAFITRVVDDIAKDIFIIITPKENFCVQHSTVNLATVDFLTWYLKWNDSLDLFYDSLSNVFSFSFSLVCCFFS